MLLCIVITLPIFFILIESLKIDDFLNNLQNNIIGYLNDTGKLIFYTCIFSLLMGVPSAWIITHYDIRFKTTLDLLLVLPLSIPCYIMAFTYADILGYNGYLDIFLQKMFLVNITFDVLSIEWLSFFLALALYPYVYTTSRISFSLIGKTYLDLAKSLGLPSLNRFFKVALPLSFSGIFAGTLLIIMEVLNEYGAVNYFGIKTFSVGIFKYWFSMDQKSIAILFAVFLLIIVFLLIGLSNYFKKSNSKLTYHLKSSLMVSKPIKSITLKLIHYSLLFVPIFFGLFVPLFFIINNVKKI